ncbi:MAG: acyltransferase [Chitinophagaceae bacterium]|nr:acyltransferase [Chitinophagaceae bacterium]
MYKTNNFDLIRLLAALQVLLGHAWLVGFFKENWLYNIIWFIPGVPIFFGMSGFLLLWSLQRNPTLMSYFKNRFLRLFPALWATMLLTALILLGFRVLTIHTLFDPSAMMYFAGRCTVIFSFVPAVIKGFAQGNPNGSLWTIGVELQFYLLLPLLYLLIRRSTLFVQNLFLVSVGLISWWVDRHDPDPPFNVSSLNGYLQILVSEVRIFYYLFFFVIGMLFYLNYHYLKGLLERRFLIHLILYAVICLLSYRYTDISKVDRYAPDPLSLLRHIFLMLMVFSAAFSNTGLSERWLKGNDYSYGIYLTHLLIINTFYQLNMFSGVLNFFLSALVTGILAFLSWHFIEKKALELKKQKFIIKRIRKIPV